MRMPHKFVTAASAVAIMLSAPIVMSSAANAAEASAVSKGKKVAFHRKKGNCLACHAIKGGRLPGNIGPPLVNMKDRFPSKSKLKDQIWDATQNNPNTIMPPFGKHNILTKDELDLVVEFVYSL